MNQCDGCARGLPVNDHGNHFDKVTELPIMACTKDRYTVSAVEGPTPRTDAQAVMGCAMDGAFQGVEWVEASLARQLERELSEAHDDVQRLHREKMELFDQVVACAVLLKVEPRFLKAGIAGLLSRAEAAEKGVPSSEAVPTIPPYCIQRLEWCMERLAPDGYFNRQVLYDEIRAVVASLRTVSARGEKTDG